VHLILSRRGRQPLEEMPEGERLARQLGCFSCHGELGQGGVENPGSLKGYVPGFFGRDFDLLTDGADRDTVRQWIRDGMPASWSEPWSLVGDLSRWFLKRQAIEMPAFGSVLSEEQLEVLVDTCLELHRLGPLGLEHLGFLAEGPPEAGGETGTMLEPGAEPSFVRDVEPILERRCVRCHGAETQKSGYRLDTVAAALQGGAIAALQRRPAIVPGDASASLLIEMIECQEEDETREIYPMPPKEDGSLSLEQISRLRAWIDTGADWPPGAVLRDTTKAARTEWRAP
jgi:cytochrome c551/c552